MQELYLDDVAEKDVESHVEASDNLASDLIAEKEKGNPNVVAETLEIQKEVTGDNATLSDTVGEGIVQDSPDVEETVTDQVVEEALNSLKDTIPNPNVAPDVTTSLAQDEPTPDTVGNAGNTEEQVDKEPATDENVVPQTEKEPVADEEEDTDTPSTDNVVSVDDDVVDVDAMDDLQQTVSEVAGEVVQNFSPQRLLSVVTIEHSSIGSRIQCKTKIMIKEMKIDCPLLKRRE
ncbi:hypothetical protein P8452_01751 [Trifolium repens]|nr:hypothetical protein P8452_01751 [Trifolium repens]